MLFEMTKVTNDNVETSSTSVGNKAEQPEIVSNCLPVCNPQICVPEGMCQPSK